MEKIKNYGFSLVELLVYFCILSILATILFNAVVTAQLGMTHEGQRFSKLLSFHLAKDVLSRDLRAAPINTGDWYKTSPAEIIWRSGRDKAIGWWLKGEDLIRCQGIYNSITHQWKKKITSIVARNIKKLEFVLHDFTVEEKKYVKAISFLIHPKDKPDGCCCLVALRNRVVV